jgi:hypothetical protein
MKPVIECLISSVTLKCGVGNFQICLLPTKIFIFELVGFDANCFLLWIMSKLCYGCNEQVAGRQEIKRRVFRSSWSCVRWIQLSARRLSWVEGGKWKFTERNSFWLKFTSVNPCRTPIKMPPFCPFIAVRYEQNNSTTAELNFQHGVKEFTTCCWAFSIYNEITQFERLIYVEV